MQHRDLNNVARRTLDRHVDGFAFGSFADVRIAIVNTRQGTDTAVKRADKTLLARLHWNLVHVAAHTSVGRVVIVDHFPRLLAADADALGQPPWLDRVRN